MEQEFYCYYSTQRPIDIGTFPKPPGNACQRRCDFVVFRRTGNAEKWRVKVCSL